MSQNNGSTVATLAKPRFTDADFEAPIDEDVSSSEEIINTNEAESTEAERVEAGVQTFDSLYADDPLRDQWLAFGTKGRELSDPRNLAAEWVAFGAMLYNLQLAEKKQTPTAYARSKVMAKAKNVLSVCGCTEGMNKPNEIISVYFVARLDLSVPGEAGKPRTFVGDVGDPEWFRGNISRAVLRSLAKCIDKASKPDESDVWEYVKGMESVSRTLIKRLHNDELSVNQVDELIAYHLKRIAKEADEASRSLMSAAQLKAKDAQQIADAKESKLTKLRQLVRAAKTHATDECGHGQEDLRDFMVSQGVIPAAAGKLSPKDLAATLTPGEAKALVQELVNLYPTDPSRLNVFKALYGTCKAVVEKMKAESQDKPARKSA